MAGGVLWEMGEAVMIAMNLAKAAASLDMEPAHFLQAVRDGDLPMPVSIGGHIRWAVRDLDCHYEDAPSKSLTGMMQDHGVVTD